MLRFELTQQSIRGGLKVVIRQGRAIAFHFIAMITINKPVVEFCPSDVRNTIKINKYKRTSQNRQ
jgi:hypothetical protein